ncbi:MAG: efflux RND transporter periplasmic adaptor subunit [Woeseiaceae bacterium]|nr:efflux RND transporter periplasmic adaptor subunit [Woeseiaceae bacterium]
MRMTIAGLAACFALLVACGGEQEDPVPVVRPIKIMTVADGGGGRVLQYAGRIRAADTAELGFEVAGRIIELRVVRGQHVEAGDLLARLDPADFQAQLDKAEADYRAAESTFRRFEELVETGAVSRQDLVLRQRNFEVSEAALATARKALADTRLLAPFAGNIGLVYVENFVNVQAKENVVLLQELSALEVLITVPEQDWSRANPNMSNEERTARVRPTVSLASLPGREFPARLTEVSTVADPVTRTFEARLTFDAPDDASVLPGMTANVTIRVTGENPIDAGRAIMVPASAVIGDETGSARVWRVDPESMIVSAATVTVGDMSGDQIRVMSGIVPGDRIAVSGVHNLREGMQVRELQ